MDYKTYTITYTQPDTQTISLDFLQLVDKVDRSLPQEAYVQGVSLDNYAIHIRSAESIENLQEIATKLNSDKYIVTDVFDTTTPTTLVGLGGDHDRQTIQMHSHPQNIHTHRARQWPCTT